MQVKFYLLRKFSTMGHPLFPEHRLLSPECPAGPGRHLHPHVHVSSQIKPTKNNAYNYLLCVPWCLLGCVADLSPLSSFCEVLDVEGSTAVFCEGQPTQGLYLLVEGCVQVKAAVETHKHT